MRLLLLAAAAASPLALAAGQTAAQTAVSTSTSTPLSTSTAGDVVIASGGTINVGANAAGVTVNSNNSVLNQGAINANDADNATGILVQGGHTGRVENAGSISIQESYTASDTANNDGLVEAPFAQGHNRYGIRLTGPGAFTGDIVGSAGAITVKGVNSYGISLEAPLIGALSVTAPITLTGDGGSGLRETAGVTGPVTLSGPISITGANSTGASLTGDIGGRLSLYSTVVDSGYASTTRLSTEAATLTVEKTPADVQQSASPVVVGANVAGGVFFGAPPANTATGSTDDLDGDGVPDGSEGTSSITNFGSAPAVVVGATGRSVTLGDVGAGDNAFGLIIRGSISGQGVYDGVTGTGLQLGVAGGGPVSLSDGLRVVGSITGGAYNADATGVHILSGVNVPLLRNEGTIGGGVAASTDAVTARAILIDAGARVASLTNSGAITAASVGDKAGSAAIVDRSGALSFVDNSGSITATITPTAAADVTTGTVTALDLSANTTGVLLRQEVNSGGGAPAIVGDVLLGSGPNRVELLGGSITGALQLGGAPSSFLIGSGATYSGALRYTGSQLALGVSGGTLNLTAANPLRLSSLQVDSGATLRFAVDAANGTSSALQVSGPATLADGTKIGVNVLTTTAKPTTVTLVSAQQLTLGTLDTSLLFSLPFLVSANLDANSPAGTVQLTLQRRTAAELGLDTSSAPALDVIASGVNAQPAAAAALLGQTNQAGFSNAFRQLLPERGEGVLRFADLASRAVGEATGEPGRLADAGHAWVQQLVIGFEQDADPSRERARAGGYGAAGGVQTDQGPLGAVGATAMIAIGTTDALDRPAAVQVDVTELEGGVYWRAAMGGFRLEARGGAGYMWLHGSRGIAIGATSNSAAFDATSVNDHDAYTLSGRFGGSYQLDLGRFFVRPQAHLDYLYLNEDGYTETGGGSGVDLTVASRTGSLTSGVGSVVFGARFGSDEGVTWRPSVELGVRDVFSGDTGALTAGYGSGSTFTLTPLSLTGTNTLAKLKLTASGKGYDLGVEASGEARSGYREGALRAVARFAF